MHGALVHEPPFAEKVAEPGISVAIGMQALVLAPEGHDVDACAPQFGLEEGEQPGERVCTLLGMDDGARQQPVEFLVGKGQQVFDRSFGLLHLPNVLAHRVPGYLRGFTDAFQRHALDMQAQNLL